MRKKAKTGEGKGNEEKAEESRQRPLSRQETSLLGCKKFICVREKKHSEPRRLIGALVDIPDVHRNTT